LKSNLVNKFINNVILPNDKNSYAVIIGKTPSKGARSPLLWNAAFAKYKIDAEMVPMDVDESNLSSLLRYLESDKDCIGGAIAMPYKESAMDWLNGRTTKEAKKIGAINCLYRNINGEFFGTNTDGEASLLGLLEEEPLIKNKKILILGLGGAGKSVSTYISKELENSQNLYLASRSHKASIHAKEILAQYINWNQLSDLIEDIDIIINCTCLGSGDFIKESPLSERDICLLKKNTLVYDINYNPNETFLLKMAKKHGCKTINGIRMNLYQAAVAFNFANQINGRAKKTLAIMEKVKS
jgi:shikimate dehydrogenase